MKDYRRALNRPGPCTFPRGVRISAVDVEALELDGVGRVDEPPGDGNGAVVVGPPDASALVPAVDLEEGGPLLSLRRYCFQEDVGGLLLVHHHVIGVESAAEGKVPEDNGKIRGEQEMVNFFLYICPTQISGLPLHVRLNEWVSIQNVVESRVGVHFGFHQGRRHEAPGQKWQPL